MSLDNLPVEWCLIQLGHIVNVNSGVGFPKEFQGRTDQPIPVYKVSDVSYSVLNQNGMLQTANNSVSQGDLDKLKGHLFNEGSTLFAKIGEAVKLNRRAYVKRKGLADNNVMGVTPLENVSNKYIFYFLHTIDLALHSRSTTIPSIRKSDIEELPISFPALAEQQEIVRQLDVMLAQVEQIKARLDAIPAILKKFRQSVLADAVSGKLTEEWRGLNNIEDWKWGTWFDITTKNKDAFKRGPFGSSLKKSMFVEKGFKVYEQYCPINDDCSYARYYITPEKFEEMKEFEVKDGDFLISCSGVSLGRITQVPLNSERGIINQALLRVRLDNSRYDSDFFKILFRSPTFQKVIFENSTGSAIPNLKAAKLLKQIPVPMPSLMEQKNIVAIVYELYRSISLIEKSVESAQKRVNLLTQSILAKAFSGELTAEWREQHQELITGINSAESLLAKIQAEREVSKPAKKTRKKKEV